MANTSSARKQIRVSEKKRIRNRGVRSEVRTFVAKARKALLQPAAGVNVEEAVRSAVKALDRAAEKGILHRNNVIRRKSRLTSMAYRLMQGTGDSEAARASAAGGAKGKTTKPAVAKTAAKNTATKKPASKTTTKAATKPAAAAAKKSK